jgi:hypothetical protein
MDRNELRQRLEATFLRRDPEVELQNARRAVYEAECALRSIEESLETFDRESIYRIGWYEGGDQYWRKCDTRQTSNCYYATERHGSERRFRRAEVESDKIPSSSYKSFHLGRFVYEDMLNERADRINALSRFQTELQVIEEQIATGRPAIGSLEEYVEDTIDRLIPAITPSSGEVNWREEGF